VDLIFPMESFEVVQQMLAQYQQPTYDRVTMTLQQMIECYATMVSDQKRESFVKKSRKLHLNSSTDDILILSEGQSTVDNMFTVKQSRTLVTYRKQCP
jgi:hypothetical protein